MESILSKGEQLCYGQKVPLGQNSRRTGAFRVGGTPKVGSVFNFQKLPCELRLEILRLVVCNRPPCANRYGRLYHKLLSRKLSPIRGAVLDVVFHTVPVKVAALYVEYWHAPLIPDFIKMHDAVHGKYKRHRMQLRPGVELSRHRFLDLVERLDQSQGLHSQEYTLLEIHELQRDMARSAKDLRALARKFYLGSDSIFIDGKRLSDESEQVSSARERKLEAMWEQHASMILSSLAERAPQR